MTLGTQEAEASQLPIQSSGALSAKHQPYIHVQPLLSSYKLFKKRGNEKVMKNRERLGLVGVNHFIWQHPDKLSVQKTSCIYKARTAEAAPSVENLATEPNRCQFHFDSSFPDRDSE